MPELPPRVRLVVIFGGRSAEHDVSRVSAREVIAALDPGRYEVVPIGIDRDGSWLRADATAELLAAGAPDELPSSLPVDGPAIDPLPILRPASGDDIPVVVFPVLHGPNGEDGTVQGLLELAGVPYIGAGVLGSALAMDKAKAKEVLAHHGIPQARYRAAVRWEITDELLDDIAAELGDVVFVKPANMGSSVGVTKARGRAELFDAVSLALEHDDWLVVEEAVTGHEIEIGVLGNEAPRASVAGEIVPAADFYDYQDKYVDGRAKLVIPADLPDDVAVAAADLALRAYRALRCEVLARVDLFWVEGERGLLLNEVNTLPGCTPVSMFPLLWQASGLSYPALLDELVRLALDRAERRSSRAAAGAPRFDPDAALGR